MCIRDRAYAVYGGSLEDAAGPSFADTFTDAGQVSDWALDSAEAMWALGVMGGTGDGLFSPLGLYTRVQCIVTFLRLWPVSYTHLMESSTGFRKPRAPAVWNRSTG